jgi:hypothetical protein
MQCPNGNESTSGLSKWLHSVHHAHIPAVIDHRQHCAVHSRLGIRILPHCVEIFRYIEPAHFLEFNSQ